MSDELCAPPRATRYTAEREYQDATLDDMADHFGADGFTVRGALLPSQRRSRKDRKWDLEPEVGSEQYARLPGHRMRGTTPDPLDDPTFTKRGRQADILYNGAAFPCTSNFTTEQSKAAHAAVKARAVAGKAGGTELYDGEKGTLTRVDAQQVMTRVCKHCAAEFDQVIGATQKKRWAWFCTDECRAADKRRADRERLRAKRETRA
jgi:hypothetical protein